MKRIMSLFLIIAIATACTACGSKENDLKEIDATPKVAQVKTICELATMDCYYHNVAKYQEKDVGWWFWEAKDRTFWIEYSGTVRVGIDASLLKINVEGNDVSINIPPAKVLSCIVDDNTLNNDSFIIASNSASVKAEHQIQAFNAAQEKMYSQASSDTTLLSAAQQRAQTLIEEYIKNLGEHLGKSYNIKWIYTNEEQNV